MSELPAPSKLINPLHAVSDAARRLWLNRRSAWLADLFAAPDSATRIAQIVAAGHETPVLAAIGRTGLASTGTSGSPNRLTKLEFFASQ